MESAEKCPKTDPNYTATDLFGFATIGIFEPPFKNCIAFFDEVSERKKLL